MSKNYIKKCIYIPIIYYVKLLLFLVAIVFVCNSASYFQSSFLTLIIVKHV